MERRKSSLRGVGVCSRALHKQEPAEERSLGQEQTTLRASSPDPIRLQGAWGGRGEHMGKHKTPGDSPPSSHLSPWCPHVPVAGDAQRCARTRRSHLCAPQPLLPDNPIPYLAPELCSPRPRCSALLFPRWQPGGERLGGSLPCCPPARLRAGGFMAAAVVRRSGDGRGDGAFMAFIHLSDSNV